MFARKDENKLNLAHLTKKTMYTKKLKTWAGFKLLGSLELKASTLTTWAPPRPYCLYFDPTSFALILDTYFTIKALRVLYFKTLKMCVVTYS